LPPLIVLLDFGTVPTVIYIYIYFFYDYFYFFTIYGVILDSITLNSFQYLLLYNYFSISVGGLESIYSWQKLFPPPFYSPYDYDDVWI